MLLFKKLLLIIFIYFLSIVTSFSDQKVAFIDLDFVVENTVVGKEILNELKNLNFININKLKLREDELKIKEEEIKKKKNIISESEFNNEINLLKDKIKVFRNEKNLIVLNFKNEKNKKIKNLFDQMNPIIQNI